MADKKSFQVQIESTVKLIIPEKPILKLVRHIFTDENFEQKGALSIVLVDDAYIQTLNRNYLNHDYPTDVLAFPLDDESDALWGEIYISVDRARQQAAAYRQPLRREIARLIIHGVLHLMGYQDHDDRQMKKMKTRQERYLSKYENIFT